MAKPYILNFIVGPQGPQGKQGTQGPSGAQASSLEASQVTVTNAGYSNVQEALDALLFVPVSISLFIVPVTVIEKGSTLVQVLFSWALNKDGVSQSISGTNISPTSVSPSLRSTLITVNLTDTGVYTLSVNDGVSTITRDLTINFYNGVYFGDAVLPGVVDSAFILSLSRTLQAGRQKTWTINAGASQYAWYAYPKALGQAQFKVGGFDGGFTDPITVAFENGSGYTEDYYVSRSINPGIGPGLTAQAL